MASSAWTHQEAELRRRFQVRTEVFVHGGFRAELLLPRSSEALIDESEFNTDERLPYWAELWPSSRALTRFLLDRAPPLGRVLELGAGIALPALALHARGVEVLATDYYGDALLFAQANAARNGLPPLPTALMDWREPGPEMGSFELLLAADVLYEQRNVAALAAALPLLLRPRGRFLLADPERVYLGEFCGRMEAAGWAVRELARNYEPSPISGEGVNTRVRILELRQDEG